jgi:hypothetical protein
VGVAVPRGNLGANFKDRSASADAYAGRSLQRSSTMTQFNITLERTVTTREIGRVVVDASDLGEAERVARQRVRGQAQIDVDWRADLEDAGRVVVVDVEEISTAAAA